MQQSIILVSTRDGESGAEPYRTGGFAVVTEAAIKNILKNPVLVAIILKRRFAFVPDTAWRMLGLPLKGSADATH